MRFLVNVIDDRTNSGTTNEMRAVDAFNEKLQDGGHWVFAAGVTDPTESVLVDGRGSASEVSDGPFATTTEWVSGFWVIEATDLEEAQALMLEGSHACNRRLEIRPLI